MRLLYLILVFLHEARVEILKQLFLLSSLVQLGSKKIFVFNGRGHQSTGFGCRFVAFIKILSLRDNRNTIFFSLSIASGRDVSFGSTKFFLSFFSVLQTRYSTF